MQTFGDVVPESGQREFNYAGSGLSGVGWSSFFAGLLFSIVGAALFVGVLKLHADNPASVHGPLWAFLLFLSIFVAVGVGILCAGLAYVRAVWNEKIVLTPTEVAWVDRSGNERVRCSYSQIRHVDETVLTQGRVRFGGSGYAPPPEHHRCAVTTDAGMIVFSDNIADYERLKAFFLSHEPPAQAKGVFRYRSVAVFVAAAFIFPITAFLFYTFLENYLNGDQTEVNGVMQQTPVYVPLLAGVAGGAFWAILGYFILSVLFERIVLAGGRVRYVNAIGIRKVDVPLTLVERGSFEQNDSVFARGGFRYRIATPQGRVKWSDQISGCTDLVRILQAASNESALGSEPVGNPLDPGVGDIPR